MGPQMTSRFGEDAPYEGQERRKIDLMQNSRIQTLEMQMADIALVMADAVENGMRRAMTDPDVVGAMFSEAMKQGQRSIHERAGRLLFSKWTGILGIMIVLASYIGWPSALKMFLGIDKPAP